MELARAPLVSESTDILTRTFDREFRFNSINYCCGIYNFAKFDTLNYMRDTFRLLKEKALEGRVEVMLDLPEKTLRVQAAVTLSVFVQLGIKYTGEGVLHRPVIGHALLCQQGEIKVPITLRWDPSNIHLDPKPVVEKGKVPISGQEWLNDERKRGQGTSAKLILGQYTFPVHRDTVRSFSEWFRLGSGFSASKEGWTIDWPYSQSLGESLVQYMYIGKLDAQLPQRELIELIFLGNYLLDERLKSDALIALLPNAERLNARDRLLLFFHGRVVSFPDLKRVCEWLLRQSPKFYEELIQPNVDPMDFLMLLAIAPHFEGDVQAGIFSVWNDFSTKQKCALLQTALDKRDHLDMLKAVLKFSKASLPEIPKSDEDREQMVKLAREAAARITATDIQ